MKETFYFAHDYNARNDDKLLELRDKYKNEGYAVYFYCVETMAERGDGYIMPSLIGGLSLGYGVAKEWLKEFLDFCVEINLLNKDENGYFSQRMIEHLNTREMFKQQGIKGAKIRWKNSPPNAKERKGKESKVNNTIVANATNVPFNSKEWIEKCCEDKQSHIRLIGNYMRIKKMNFPTKKTAEAELRRNTKPATLLKDYPPERRKQAMLQANKMTPQWTLETILKYLHK
jgi:hypothetical protein